MTSNGYNGRKKPRSTVYESPHRIAWHNFKVCRDNNSNQNTLYFDYKDKKTFASPIQHKVDAIDDVRICSYISIKRNISEYDFFYALREACVFVSRYLSNDNPNMKGFPQTYRDGKPNKLYRAIVDREHKEQPLPTQPPITYPLWLEEAKTHNKDSSDYNSLYRQIKKKYTCDFDTFSTMLSQAFIDEYIDVDAERGTYNFKKEKVI